MGNGTLRKIAALLAGCALVVVGTDAITYAGTGDSLILGKINKAFTTTTVNNQGRGPVLNLIGGRTYPPLKVNSKKKVANLNADTVDGLDSKVLEPGVFRAVIAARGSTPPSSSPTLTSVKLPAGTYLVTLNGIITNPTASTDGTFICLVVDAEKTFVTPVNFSGVEVAAQKDLSVGPGEGVFSESDVYTIAANHHTAYSCTGSATTGSLTVAKAVVVTFRKVSTPKNLPSTPYTPPAPRMMARFAQH